MHLWLQAIVMMCGSKKGISSNQLHRTLGVTLRTAWHLSHRIRLAMDESGSGPLGGPGKTLESDETFIGYKDGGPTWEFHSGQGWRKKRAWGDRNAVLTLVEREGRARSIKLDSMKAVDVRAAVLSNADTKSDLKTDELITYRNLGKRFASHESVNHGAEEWVRGEAHVNTVEGYFSIFKRGMTGIYQHCSERHLHRYLAEFDFRYSNRVRVGVDDGERTARAVKGAVGKRLTYRTTRSEETHSPTA